MKKINTFAALCLSVAMLCSCQGGSTGTDNGSTSGAPEGQGQADVQDTVSEKDIVKIAASSPDHKTLVAAVKAGELLDALANPGPLTVFAPTDEAFNKLLAGTVDGLLKPEKKSELRSILQYHVTTSSLPLEFFKDGMTVGMANGGSAKISIKDGKVQINGANIIASVKASNGMVHVIDAVLLPPAK